MFITVSLFLFAFTTLLGNFYYAETGLAYLCGMTPSNGAKWCMRIVAAVVVCVGATMKLGIVWDTADVLMGFMALINVPVIVILLKPVLRCLEDYTEQKKAGKNPVFKGGAYWTEGEGGLLELGTIFPGMELDMEIGEGAAARAVLLGTG